MSRRSEHTTKVFVGSLPPNVTADDLRQLFSPYGAIAECDIANRCGFLHLEDKDLATKAIEELNNTSFMGGMISVEKGRVKPRGERRVRNMKGSAGGPMGMRRPRDGPYSREPMYGGMGGPRNGGYGRSDFGYDDFRRDYPQPAGFDDYRRPMYDDRRDTGVYMGDRRGYNNGYDRRYDERPGYDMQRPTYDDRRMPAAPAGYDDRRQSMGGDRRSLLDEQSMGQTGPRPPITYDRAPLPTVNMYSRRDSTPKPIPAGYDRNAPAYGTYNNATAPPAAYGAPAPNTGYTTANYTSPQSTGYGDARPSGYIDNRQHAAPVTGGGYTSAGYSSVQSGGYGDNYSVRAPPNTYDSAYPPLPQQRGW